MIWCYGGRLSGQNATLTNPSACPLEWPLTDFNCSDDGIFFNPDRFDIVVTNAPGTALGQDVYLREVRLLIEHSWAGDLDLSLRSPGGRTVVLSADNGGGNDHYGNPSLPDCEGYMRFSMASCRPISTGEAPFIDGPYLPQESFYNFNDGTTAPNGTWTLQICDDADEDAGILRYVELIFDPIDCLPVENVEVVGVDTTTATIYWSAAADCGNAIIEYGPAGFQPGTGAVAGQGQILAVNDCPPFQLRDLAPETIYELYVRKACSTGSFSGNSCPVTFRTGCRPAPPTINETFDDQEECAAACDGACPLTGFWYNSEEAGASWLVNSGPTATQGTGPEADVSGSGNYLYLETTDNGACPPGIEAVLLSNCVRFDRAFSDTCHLSFYYHMYGSNTGHLALELSTDDGRNWSTLWQKSGDQGNTWQKVYLGLNNLAEGDTVRFRFVAARGDGAKGDIAIDAITFYGSEDLGRPSEVYYADADADGFGDAATLLRSCSGVPPPGYVDNGDDCDDNDPAINPGQPEIPCDGIDNNCSGEADDLLLPSPLAVPDTICSGGVARICATPRSGKSIFWYGSPDGDDFLFFGECYEPVLPENNSPLPVIYRFYAEESDFVCRSENRTEVVVVVNPNPVAGIADDPSVCPGQSIDLRSLNITDEHLTGGAVTFHSATPANSTNVLSSTLVTPGETNRFYFLITSPGGCTDEGAFTLRVKPGPELSFSPADSFALCRESSTPLTVQATGGTAPYQYLWSSGQRTSTVELRAAFAAGVTQSYGVTVTDAEGCFSLDTARLTTIVNIDAVRRSIGEVSSCQGEDGSISLTPLSGLPPFRFEWTGSDGSGGDTVGITETLQLDGLAQGSYRFTITDNSAEACAFIMRSVQVNGPDAIVGDPEIRAVTCAGADDGSICLDVEGNAPQYRWSTGDTTQCLENIGGGTYSVTITDGLCENVLSDLVVGEPPPLSGVSVSQSPACSDAADGSISFTAFGGTPPYAYRWNTGATTAMIDGLSAGTYLLTVFDSNDCSFSDTIQLEAPLPLNLQLDSVRSVSCFGAGDGYLQVGASGGTLPYNYRWASGSTAPVRNNLGPGIYAVTVTDGNGCSQSASFEIVEPAPLSVFAILEQAPVCVGDTTGAIRVDGLGGTSPFDFRWADGSSGSVRTGLGVGSYTVILTDANGCRSDSLTVQLDAASTLELNADIQNPQCAGAGDGRISLQPGGTGPFIYAWDRGDDGPLLTGASVGNYGVQIIDGKGCRYDTAFTLTAPQVLDVVVATQAPSCSNSSDGLLTATVLDGGTEPYRYEWSSGDTTRLVFGIDEGQFQVTVTDENNCRFVSDSIAVLPPEPLSVQAGSIGPIRCKGETNGFIELAVRGGVAPYQYNWLTINEDAGAVFDLPAGTYPVQVLDANNCPASTSIVIPEPEPLLVVVDASAGQGCQGDGVSRLVASVSGGVAPYEYAWSTGDESNLISNLEPGDYAVTVADANRCTETVPSVKVREAIPGLELDTFAVTDISCYGAGDGSMTATVSGGKPPFRFHFSNNNIVTTNARTVTRTGLPRSSGYNVTVTDLNTGCFVVAARVPLQEPALLSYRLDSIRPVECAGGDDGALIARVLGGTAPYQFRWLDQDGMVAGTSESLRAAGAGIFRAIVQDVNGCIDTIPPTEVRSLNPPLLLPDSLLVVRDLRCRGIATGAIDISLTGGIPPYAYRWSNGATSEDIDSLPSGLYQLTVTDSKNCQTVFDPVPVAEPDSSILVSGNIRDISCFGESDGQLAVNVRGGVRPYRLLWTLDDQPFAIDTLLLRGLRAGTYRLTVLDQAGCERLFPFSLEEPPLLIARIEEEGPSGESPSGRLLAMATGGTPDYNYRWSDGTTTPAVDTIRLASYGVTVTDQNNCMATDFITLTSVQQSELAQSVQLYPNPSHGQVFLDVVLSRPAALRIELFDQQGRRLGQQSLPKAARQNLQLNWRHLPPGTYWIRLLSEDETVYPHEPSSFCEVSQ